MSHLIRIDLHSGQCSLPFTVADERVILWGTITGVAIVVCASHAMPALFAISFAIIGSLFRAVLAPHEVTFFLAFPYLIAILVLGDVTKHFALVACPTCRLSSGEERVSDRKAHLISLSGAQAEQGAGAGTLGSDHK